MDNAFQWYTEIIKPPFAPPPEIFSIVWSILYPIIFFSYGYTIFLVYKKKLTIYIMVPLLINLLANFSFSYIQFVLRNNYLATVDITIVLITIIWFMLLVKPYSKNIAYLQIPYLLWVSFATILQISVTWLNR